MELDDPRFKKEFWDWFDSISSQERRKFQEYNLDMAELYFYNKIYRHKEQNIINTKHI
jgi:hypothetical protein